VDPAGTEQTPSPALQVVTGSPTEEELAAVVVVMAAASVEPAPDPAPRERSRWAAAARLARPPLAPGPGAWVGSARPH
jgi:hypothetical protein